MNDGQTIKLSKNKYTIVDNDLYEYLNSFKWYASETENLFYAYRTIKSKGKKQNIAMHRLILNATKNTYVDHINGDTLDNRICNLRIVTNSQNAQNHKGQPKQRKHTKLKGVKKNTQARNSWSARITVNNKQIYLGSFKTEEDAYKAYCDAGEKYHGEFFNKG